MKGLIAAALLFIALAVGYPVGSSIAQQITLLSDEMRWHQQELNRLEIAHKELALEREQMVLEHEQAEHQAALAAVQHNYIFWNGIAWAFGLMLVAVPILVLVMVWQHFQDRRKLVWPTRDGTLPIPMENSPVRSDLYEAAYRALTAFHHTRMLAAANTGTPAHYSPHLTYRSEQAAPVAHTLPGDPAHSMLEEHETPPLPGLTDLLDIRYQPTTEHLLLALGPGGAPVSVSVKQLMHCGLVGATGAGKSNIGRLLLAQLLRCNVDCVIADPHFTEYDAENDEDWRPIARRLRFPAAVDPATIGETLRWFLAELEQRKKLRERSERWGAPILLYLDELPDILETVDGSLDALATLLRQGRKYHLYVISATQDMLTKTLGKSGGAIRNCYRTAFYSGGDTHSATVLLDIPQKEINTIEGNLGQGIVLLRSASSTPAQLVRVPLVSNESIYHLLEDNHPTMPRVVEPAAPAVEPSGAADEHNPPAVEPPEEPSTASAPASTPASAPASAAMESPQWDVKADRVLQLMRVKTPVNQMIREVWGVAHNTREGKKALEELREIQARFAAMIER